MKISKKYSESEINKQLIEGSIIDDLKRKFSSSGLSKFFSDLLKSDRRIDTTRSEKTADGDLVYYLNLVFLQDGDPATSVPAVLRVSRLSEDDTSKVNMYLKLPAENYSESKQMVDVDTTEYQNMDNSKEQIGKACWKLFDSLDYTKDDSFLSQFITEDLEDKLDFSTKNSDKYVTFIHVTESGEEQEIVVYVDITPTEDGKVNIGFRYPDKNNLSNKKLLSVKDKYTNVENSQEAILQKCRNFINSEYGVDAISDWSPEQLTASEDITTNSNKKIIMCVEKIPVDTGYDIYLKNIKASYDATEVLQDLDNILTEEFTDSIEESIPSTYDMVVTDDSYCCNLLNDSFVDDNSVDYIESSCNAILNAAWTFYCNCLQIKYTACGRDLNTIRNTVDSFSWMLQSQIDRITSMMVEFDLEVINTLVRLQTLNTDRCYIYQDTDFESFYSTVHEDLTSYLSTLELYCCNLPPIYYEEVQNWIRSWNNEIKYTLERMSM